MMSIEKCMLMYAEMLCNFRDQSEYKECHHFLPIFGRFSGSVHGQLALDSAVIQKISKLHF